MAGVDFGSDGSFIWNISTREMYRIDICAEKFVLREILRLISVWGLRRNESLSTIIMGDSDL